MKKILYILIILPLLISCTDLEEETFDKIAESEYPENPAQVATITVASYSALFDLIDDNGWWFLAQEISSDEFCGPTRDADWDDGGKWRVMHRHTWSNDVEGVNRMWEKMYYGVVECNKALDNLKTLQQTETVKRKTAEVKVLRSFYYYLLIDNYGDVPYITSFSNAPEQPFKTRREEIFDSLTDVIKSNLNVLTEQDQKYLITKNVGYALLAKLYLNAETYTGTPEWINAENYTDSILLSPNYSMASDVLSTFITDNNNASEIIFSIPFDEDNSHGFRLHMRTLHYNHNEKFDMDVGPWNGLCITPDQWARYSDDDLRKDGYNIYGAQYASDGEQIIDGETNAPLNINPILPALYMTAADYTINEYRNSGARVGKYEIKMGAKENLSNDFPIFRLSDFILMKAECRIRLAGAGAGDQWITEIRQRAGLNAASGFGLEELLDERARELYVEGHRRQDLIRFDKFTEPWWEKGGQYDGVSGDPSVETFPIPQWAINTNPNLALDPQ